MKLLRTLAVLFMTSLLSFAGLADEGRHIVFIHGINSNAGCWTEMAKLLVQTGVVKEENILAIDYGNKTSLIGSEDWPEWAHGIAGYNENLYSVAMKVSDEIDAFRAFHGNPKIDIVVHSMGGLITRAMVKEGFLDESVIDKFITLATPHYGQDNLSISTQTDEMNYGSVFMWNLAHAELKVNPAKILCVVGNGDCVVDYYAAWYHDANVRYVNKSHAAPSREGGVPAICACDGGASDVVFHMVAEYLTSGNILAGDGLDLQGRNPKGGVLLQIINQKGQGVPFSTQEIIRRASGNAHEYHTGWRDWFWNGEGEIQNQCPFGSKERGIIAVANEERIDGANWLFRYGGLAPDDYKFTIAESKDKEFQEFETEDSVKIEAGQTTIQQIQAEGTKPVDFVFLIDSTGSMGGSIDSVKNNAKRLIQEKLGSGSRNCRVAIADYRDFSTSPYGNSGDYTFKLRCGFTTNMTAAIDSLSGISANGGGDGPEAVYSALASCVQGYGAALGGWRKEAVKTIMLMCDAEPHDPEPFTNYTQANIIKMLNTLEDEEEEGEASVVDEGEHRQYSMKAMILAAAKSGESGSIGGISLYPVLTTSSSSLVSTFTPLATETGGKVVNSGNYDSVASAIEKVIEQSIAANGFEYETVSVGENTGSVTIRVYGGNSSMPASVGYQVVSGTAVSGTDYTADGGVHRLSWAEGERSYKTITIPIIADGSSTSDKFFSVILCDGENMGLGGTSICRIDVLDVSSTGAGIPAGEVFVQGLARQPTLGTVTGAGLYDVDSLVTLVATPTEGNVFTSWENGSTVATRTINMFEAWSNAVNGVATYVASFKPMAELPLPVIHGADSIFAFVGDEIYWALSYDSESEVVVQCSGLPDGTALEDGAIIGVPQKMGKYSLTITVENAKGKAEKTVEFSVAQKPHIKFDGNGAESGSMVDVMSDPTKAFPSNGFVRKGYRFLGWSLDKNAHEPMWNGEEWPDSELYNGESNELILYAVWEIINYSIEYDLGGGVNAAGNPLTYTSEDEVVLAKPSREGFIFAGWSVNSGKIDRGTTGILTFVAKWIEIPHLHSLGSDGVRDGEVVHYVNRATVYDGYLTDGLGSMFGTVQVKVAKGKIDKKSGAFSAKVTATVQMSDGSKKLSFKGGIADASGNVTGLNVPGHTLTLSLGVNGMSGLMDGMYIDGTRNIFLSKDDASKVMAAMADKKWVGPVNLVGNGVVLSASIAKKGKVKISGMVDGVKVSASSQLLVGEKACLVPIVITKKANLACSLWLMSDGGMMVLGLDGANAGKAGVLLEDAAFRVNGGVTLLSNVLPSLYEAYLPDGLPIESKGSKWVVAPDVNGRASRAGKVVFAKKSTEIESTKLGVNPSGLKLSYKSKDGSFSGSFKVYALGSNGKIKSYTVNVWGVMIGDIGYGIANLKNSKVSWPITIK